MHELYRSDTNPWIVLYPNVEGWDSEQMIVYHNNAFETEQIRHRLLAFFIWVYVVELVVLGFVFLTKELLLL